MLGLEKVPSYPVCGKWFSTVLHLDNHFIAEHKELVDGAETNEVLENNVKFACYKCDKQFLEKYQLKIHSNEGCTINYSCKLCKFKITKEDYLKEHEQSKHETIKHCDMCSYKASSPKLLAEHIITQQERQTSALSVPHSHSPTPSYQPHHNQSQ